MPLSDIDTDRITAKFSNAFSGDFDMRSKMSEILAEELALTPIFVGCGEIDALHTPTLVTYSYAHVQRYHRSMTVRLFIEFAQPNSRLEFKYWPEDYESSQVIECNGKQTSYPLKIQRGTVCCENCAAATDAMILQNKRVMDQFNALLVRIDDIVALANKLYPRLAPV